MKLFGNARTQRPRRFRRLSVVFLIGLCAIPQAAQACSVCFADPDSAQGQALNAAVWTLLGATTFVLGVVIAFIGSIVIRTRAAAKEEARHA